MSRAFPDAYPVAGARSVRSMRTARVSLGRMFRAESADFFLLLGATLFMVVFGLLMVLSSSYVDQGSLHLGFFSKFFNQTLYAIIGVPIMFLLSRFPVRFWMRWSWLLLAGACLLQALVVFTPLGFSENSNQNWLKIGPILFQPSEGIKLALILWLATLLARKEEKLGKWTQGLLPALLAAGAALGLVLAGNDLGTVMIMAAVVFGALYFGGIPLRHLFGVGVVGVGVILIFAKTSANRMDRIMSFLHPSAADALTTQYQPNQALWGMANGGVFGVGLGNSESKWLWLPASSTDYIFAIIAEELGLIGAVLVLGLFVFLALVFVRILRSTPSTFARVATGGIMAWILVQALVNIAVVVGLFPVLGVPLPLVSAGGTALISTLAGIGIVLSFARQDARILR